MGKIVSAYATSHILFDPTPAADSAANARKAHVTGVCGAARFRLYRTLKYRFGWHSHVHRKGISFFINGIPFI